MADCVITIRLNLFSVLCFLIGFVIGTFIMSKSYLTSEIMSPEETMRMKKNLYDERLANKLWHEVKVLCLVMTNPVSHRTKADHVKNTWGKRCNKLLFITTQDDDELDTIVVPMEESRLALRRKSKTAFLHAHDNYLNDFDWFLKADDDSYVVMENLRYMLYRYRTETALFFGHRIAHNRSNLLESYMTGGSYVLSRKALSKFAITVTQRPKDFFWPDQAGEDMEMGRALSQNAIFVDCRDEQHQKRFFTVSIIDHMCKKRPDYWYFDRLYYEVAQGSSSCCSDVAITFHYTKPRDMYLLEYLIYHHHPYGLEKNLTEALPRKLSLSEIIAASDARNPALNDLYITTNTNVHYLESSEKF